MKCECGSEQFKKANANVINTDLKVKCLSCGKVYDLKGVRDK